MRKGFLICMTLALALLTGCSSADKDHPMVAKGDTTSSVSAGVENSDSEMTPIIITLYPEDAPISCENFEKLVSDGFYNGLTFHRVVDDFMAQGGDPTGTGTGGSEQTIKGEFSSNGVENNLSHQRGVVSMARSSNPDSASSQFFICYKDCSFLDGNYAAFGEVTQGMEVVDNFLKVSRSYGSDGAISSPDVPIKMKEVKMIDPDENNHPRVEIIMEDFLNQ